MTLPLRPSGDVDWPKLILELRGGPKWKNRPCGGHNRSRFRPLDHGMWTTEIALAASVNVSLIYKLVSGHQKSPRWLEGDRLIRLYRSKVRS